MKVSVGYVEWEIAWREWRLHSSAPDLGKAFMQYLGDKYVWDIADNYKMEDTSAARLRLLLGGHARTIIKAWEANHVQTSVD